jgi:8-oxo-dGTP diphosphatase
MIDHSNIPDCFYRIGIKALITDTEGRFLLCRESDNWWNLPGGGLEYGESPRETLKREIKEEMGLDLVSMEDQPSYFFTAKHRQWFMLAIIIYWASIQNLNITPSEECQEVRFFTPEEALRMDLFPDVVDFCKQYKI